MTKKEIKFRDPVVEHVVDKFVERSDVGFKKYKQTLDTERKTGVKDLSGYLNDVQEELMDAILYIQAAREELQDLSEEALIDRHIEKIDGSLLYEAPMAHSLDSDWDDEAED